MGQQVDGAIGDEPPIPRYPLLVTLWWWLTRLSVRLLSFSPNRRYSQITPQLFVGGQYRGSGWPKLAAWGVTAVVNMRTEYDDHEAGIAPARYLYLPTTDNTAPSLEHLAAGVTFITQELAQGGGVYIHCKSGIGRAVTMAAAYLVSTGMTPVQAWARIRQVRPFMRPTAVQVRQLEKFAAQRKLSEYRA